MTLKNLIISTILSSLTVGSAIGAELQAENLYLVGGAVSTGWNRDTAPELEQVTPGKFVWYGQLSTGEFKFLTSRNSWDSVVAETPDCRVSMFLPMSAYINNEGGDHDYKWISTAEGYYTLTLDLTAGTLTVTTFDIAQADDMAMTAYDGGIHKGAETLARGKFVIKSRDGEQTRYLVTTSDGHYTYTDRADYATVIPVFATSQATQVSIDSNNVTLQWQAYEPWDELYVVGSFNGWTFNDRFDRSAEDANEFTWSGYIDLSRGSEIKFVGASTFDPAYDSKHLHPYTSGQPLTEARTFYTGGTDNKWQVASAGIYTITVNTFRQSIRVDYNSGISTGLQQPDSRPKITSSPGAISIESRQADTITVADMSGRCVARYYGTRLRLELPAGLYLVRVGASTAKCIVK